MKKTNAFVLLLASSALLACSQGSGKSSSSSTSTSVPSSNEASASLSDASSASSDAPIVSSAPTETPIVATEAKALLTATLAKMDLVSDMSLSLNGDFTYSSSTVSAMKSYRADSLYSSSTANASLDFTYTGLDVKASVMNLNKEDFAGSGSAQSHLKLSQKQSYEDNLSSSSFVYPDQTIDSDVYVNAYIADDIGYLDVSADLIRLYYGSYNSSEEIINKIKTPLSVPTFSWAAIMQGITAIEQYNPTVKAARSNSGDYSLTYSMTAEQIANISKSSDEVTYEPGGKFDGAVSATLTFDENKILGVSIDSDLAMDFTQKSESSYDHGDSEYPIVYSYETISKVKGDIICDIDATFSYENIVVDSVKDPDSYVLHGGSKSSGTIIEPEISEDKDVSEDK
jgi:hypothetical protein